MSSSELPRRRGKWRVALALLAAALLGHALRGASSSSPTAMLALAVPRGQGIPRAAPARMALTAKLAKLEEMVAALEAQGLGGTRLQEIRQELVELRIADLEQQVATLKGGPAPVPGPDVSGSVAPVVGESPEAWAAQEQEKERQRLALERVERETAEKARAEQQRLEQEQRAEQQRQEQERLERERQERQRLEQERLEQQRLERERLEQQRLAQLEQQRLERERLERERLEKLEQARLERERLEKERQEQLRLERERQERERLERERLEAERRAIAQKEAEERAAVERAAAELRQKRAEAERAIRASVNLPIEQQKKSLRDLQVAWHPDKVRDASPEMQELAQEIMSMVNARVAASKANAREMERKQKAAAAYSKLQGVMPTVVFGRVVGSVDVDALRAALEEARRDGVSEAAVAEGERVLELAAKR